MYGTIVLSHPHPPTHTHLPSPCFRCYINSNKLFNPTEGCACNQTHVHHTLKMHQTSQTSFCHTKGLTAAPVRDTGLWNKPGHQSCWAEHHPQTHNTEPIRGVGLVLLVDSEPWGIFSTCLIPAFKCGGWWCNKRKEVCQLGASITMARHEKLDMNKQIGIKSETGSLWFPWWKHKLIPTFGYSCSLETARKKSLKVK